MTVGECIEALITIKDHNKDSLSRQEIDAINNACNMLYHNFVYSKDCEDIINLNLKKTEK